MRGEIDEGRQSGSAHEAHGWVRSLRRLNRFKNQARRYWWVPLGTVLAGLIVEGMIERFEAPVYVSSGRMIVNVKLSIPEGSLYTEELNNFLGTQAALMQSALVMQRAQERAAEQFGSAAVAAGDDIVSLKALILPRTTIFVLQGTGRDREYTQALVQACMEEYIGLKKEMRAQTSDTTLAGMTEEVLRLERELRKGDEELVGFASSNSVVLLQEQGNSAANYLAGLNQRLATLKSELGLLELLNLDQTLERQQENGPGGVSLGEGWDGSGRAETAVLADGDYLRARQQLLVLKAEREELGQDLRPAHPRMVGLAQEINRRERLLGIYREQNAQQLESRKESLRLQIVNLERDVKEWDGRALEMSRRGAELQRIKANMQRTQSLYDRLLAAMQTLDVNKQISPESVTLMEKAGPAVANRPGLGRRLVLGGLGGLVAGVLLLVLVDRLDDRVGSLFELQELFREEVLGQIPREKSTLSAGALGGHAAGHQAAGRHGGGLVEGKDERYGFVEAYRNLRSSLLYLSGNGARPKTLLVTSSVPNDGKSLTASNLAITLAEAGAKVLLVDADLRKGSLLERFGMEAGRPGLTEALASMPQDTTLPDTAGRGAPNPKSEIRNPKEARNPKSESDSRQCVNPLVTNLLNTDPLDTIPLSTSPPPWADSVRATHVPNLFLLPRGKATQRSGELFLSAAAGRFLEQAGERYGFVILDTAPVMAADDVTSLAPRVDGVLFVVRAGHSSARVARAALDLLYLRRARVLGMVFNDVRPGGGEYFCYHKYHEYGVSG